MQWIRTILEEIYGLFVDDGLFAVVIVLWLAIAFVVLPMFVGPALQGGLLIGGLLVALAESVLRKARS
jgi:hypothetical protein